MARRPLTDLIGRLRRRGRPPHDWHRDAVGGRWDEIGRLQFDLLIAHGLAPQHYLLDVGCGSLRGGVHFIPHLDPGHYFGVDVRADLIDAGRGELERAGIVGKRPTLAVRGDFEFRELGQSFDFAVAQSLFTHLPFNGIVRCLAGVSRVLRPGGRFFATFFASPGPRLRTDPVPLRVAEGVPVEINLDRDPYFYEPALFSWLCEGSDLACEHVGQWDHPRRQELLVFTKRSGG